MLWKNKNLSFTLALALSASGAVAYADSLQGNGSLQNWNSNILAADSNSPNAGTPYWNNASGDGSKENIGWCMAGGGSCTMAVGPQMNTQYYGNGPSDASMMYFNSSGNPVTISLQTVTTDQKSNASGYDIFGYYTATGSGSAETNTLVPLFDSRTSTVGDSASVSSLPVNTNYGFYIENIQGGGTPFATDYFYFMDSAANSANGSMPADNLQHFAPFTTGNGNYFLGDVDGDACQNGFQPGTSPCVPTSQFDYNDLVVEVSTSGSAVTPEPASLALIGGGLCLIGALTRRKMRLALEN